MFPRRSLQILRNKTSSSRSFLSTTTPVYKSTASEFASKVSDAAQDINLKVGQSAAEGIEKTEGLVNKTKDVINETLGSTSETTDKAKATKNKAKGKYTETKENAKDAASAYKENAGEAVNEAKRTVDAFKK